MTSGPRSGARPKDRPLPLQAALAGEVFAPASRQRLHASAIARARVPWLGIGLCGTVAANGTAMSRGLPIDVLAMLAALETVRRALHADRGVILLADSNAIAEGHSRAHVNAVSARIRETLTAVGGQLGFPLELVLGSDVTPCDRIAPAPAPAPAPATGAMAGYVRHQLAQMRAMAAAGASVKIGWRLSGDGTDEAAFDRRYEADEGAPPMAFVYAISGRGLDPSRPRACPYVAVRPEERVLLAEDEHIEAKLARARTSAPREANGYARLLGKIARSLARLSGRRAERPFERDLQALLERCGGALPSIAA